MESFFSYKNRKTKLNLFFDIKSIDFISLMQLEREEIVYEDNEDTNYNPKDDTNIEVQSNSQDDKIIRRSKIERIYRKPKKRKVIKIINLLLKIHFKNSNYHEELIFNDDDEEAYIIYNSLTEAINNNPQKV